MNKVQICPFEHTSCSANKGTISIIWEFNSMLIVILWMIIKKGLKVVWEFLSSLYHGKKVLASGGSSFLCNLKLQPLSFKKFVYVCVFLVEAFTVLCHLDKPLPDNWKQKSIYNFACPNFTLTHFVLQDYFYYLLVFILPLTVSLPAPCCMC